ncbi:MAG: hypothetical protein WDZ37_02740 [Solirubrobacterales bacterium]
MEAAAQAQRDHVLIVADETIGGRRLLEAIDARAQQGPIRCTVICPRNEPPFGYVIYDDSSRSAAQIRLDLTLNHLARRGIEADGEVGDPDAFLAAQDAVRFYGADEIIVSSYPYPRSGFLRKDLVQRIRDWSGLPVQHVVIDLNNEPVKHAIVVANQTVTGGPLLEALERRANESPHRFTVICPIGGDSGGEEGADAAKERVGRTVHELRRAGLEVVGQVMDRDPLTAIQNAVKYHPADEIIVSTFAAEKSKWLSADLINKARKATGLPVEHVIGERVQETHGTSTGAAA